jgi:hypothetical protein
MAKFMNNCIDSADWVEMVTGDRPVKDVITVEELNEISDDSDHNGRLWGTPELLGLSTR